MDEFVKQLVAKTGIDEASANRVVEFVRENWDDVVGWIGKEKLGDLGDAAGKAFESAKDSIGGLFHKG